MWSACKKDHCIISRGKLEHIDKPERRATKHSSVWDTKQIHAPVLQTDSQRHGYQKKTEKTRGVFGFHGTELWLVNASPCFQSSAVSIVSPLLSHRLTSTCTRSRSPLPADDHRSFVHDWKRWHVDMEPGSPVRQAEARSQRSAFSQQPHDGAQALIPAKQPVRSKHLHLQPHG